MSQLKRSLTQKRPSKTASALGIAGVSLAATASGSAVALPSQSMASLNSVTLGEEEVSDVSLATFHVFDFDHDNSGTLKSGILLARGGCGCGHGCGGCGHGCGGCGHGCGGCGHGCGCAHGCGRGCGCARGCAWGWGGWGGCGGCGWGWGVGGCCLSWGACIPTC